MATLRLPTLHSITDWYGNEPDMETAEDKVYVIAAIAIRKMVSNQPGAKKKPAKHFKCNSYHFNCAINSFDLDLLSKRGDKRFARFSKAVGYVS